MQSYAHKAVLALAGIAEFVVLHGLRISAHRNPSACLENLQPSTPLKCLQPHATAVKARKGELCRYWSSPLIEAVYSGRMEVNPLAQPHKAYRRLSLRSEPYCSIKVLVSMSIRWAWYYCYRRYISLRRLSSSKLWFLEGRKSKNIVRNTTTNARHVDHLRIVSVIGDMM